MVRSLEGASGTYNIAQAAKFARGLNLFQVYTVCMIGSSFAMRRFGYANEAVATFVTICSNAMRLLYMYSNLSTTLIITVMKYSLGDNKNLFGYILSGMSMVSVCFTVVLNALLLRTYAFTEDMDNVTRYYWLMVLSNFAAGIDATCISTIAADDLSLFGFARSIVGLVVAAFHWIVIKIMECCGADVDYWLIACQLTCILLLSSIAAVVWIMFLIKDKIIDPSVGNGGKSRNGDNSAMGYIRTLPMVLGIALTYGGLYTIYPYISPFQMVQFEHHYPIQRLTIVFNALAGLSVWVVDKKGGCLRKDWYTSPYVWWHLLWLLFIPYFGIGLLFIHCMHYPESGLAKSVLMKPAIVGLLTILYYTISRFMYGFSGVSISANSKGQGKIISPLSLGISLISINVSKYMAGAYVQQFKLAKEGLKAGKAWPTEGMSKHSAIRHWFKLAAKGGYANFREMSTADVKQRLGGVARRLVSYHRGSPAA